MSFRAGEPCGFIIYDKSRDGDEVPAVGFHGGRRGLAGLAVQELREPLGERIGLRRFSFRIQRDGGATGAELPDTLQQ